MRNQFIGLVVLLMLMKNVDAKDLGKHGTTFVIKEKDVIEYIQDRLKELEVSGELAKHQEFALDKAKSKLKNPIPVAGVIDTEKPREFYYDPSYTVKEDIKDHEGNILYKQGYRVNPLSTTLFGEDMLFINGQNSIQVEWVRRYIRNNTGKIILVNGSPIELGEQLGERIYFDQLGKLTEKLGIKQVPAIVSQDGMRLKIRELKLEISKNGNKRGNLTNQSKTR